VVVTSGERHEGKAGMVLFAGKTVWSMPERFVCTLVQKGAINTLPFFFLSLLLSTCIVCYCVEGQLWLVHWPYMSCDFPIKIFCT